MEQNVPLPLRPRRFVLEMVQSLLKFLRLQYTHTHRGKLGKCIIGFICRNLYRSAVEMKQNLLQLLLLQMKMEKEALLPRLRLFRYFYCEQQDFSISEIPRIHKKILSELSGGAEIGNIDLQGTSVQTSCAVQSS